VKCETEFREAKNRRLQEITSVRLLLSSKCLRMYYYADLIGSFFFFFVRDLHIELEK
jgi:hypothetical protein